MKTYIKLFTNELKDMGLSLYDKAVYGSLVTKFQYHNNSEFYTYESYIADELEISESSVKRSIKKLNEVGLISINKKYHKQLKKTVNYYIINNLISDTENFTPITCTTPIEKVEQNANNEVIQADDTTPTYNTLEIQKEKLNKAMKEYREYMGDGYELQEQFEGWRYLNDIQKEGICGCLGDISKDELTNLYKTWKRVA